MTLMPTAPQRNDTLANREDRLHDSVARRQLLTRTCVSCRHQDGRENLTRLMVSPDQGIAVNLVGSGQGRGIWVHPTGACLSRAPVALARNWPHLAGLDPQRLPQLVAAAAERRAVGLLLAARRARKLSLGVQTSAQDWAADRVYLLIVATDHAQLDATFIKEALGCGRALSWSTKSRLGNWMGRESLSVAAVLDEGIASSLARVIRMTHLASVGNHGRARTPVTEVG